LPRLRRTASGNHRRLLADRLRELRFAADSLLEGAGFELPVPGF